ncbi:MerR family transcriptional regulator [Adlercreutzia sp. ZJ242]|uniref:MerR family transcriptional regulator n=1 Tax=Adlercreutzia sp. ZJ242 TaxID=2709409 RepID=UPI001F14F5E5|nr:MerR family transcriptional regulator [Adlercreutzia sp. ZJ242]
MERGLWLERRAVATYRTSQIARIAGVHVNTVRLYEQWGFIPTAERESNGYRVFTDVHVCQIKLVRAALEIEVLQAGMRELLAQLHTSHAADPPTRRKGGNRPHPRHPSS